MPDDQARDPPRVLIDREWRIVLVVLGAALLIGAAIAWWNPPTKVEFAPQAATSGANTTANVEDRSETTTGLLIGLGVLSIVIAANGRKLTSIKIAGQEVSTDVAELAGTAKGVTIERARAQGLPPEQAEEAAKLVEAQVYGAALPSTAIDVDHLDIDAVVASALRTTILTHQPTDEHGTH